MVVNLSQYGFRKCCKYVFNCIDSDGISEGKNVHMVFPEDIYRVHYVATDYKIGWHLLFYENKINHPYTIYCRRDLLKQFSEMSTNIPPGYIFIIGEGDKQTPDDSDISYLNNLKFTYCLAQNLVIQHNNFIPLPIGTRIFGPQDNEYINRLLDIDSNKVNNLIINFQETGVSDRIECLMAIHKLNLGNNTFNKTNTTFMQDIANSYFCISPEGAGIDCYRTWEALHVKTIPIVKKSIVTDFYSKIFPMIVLDNWEQLSNYTFNKTLYYHIMDNHKNYKKYLDCQTLLNYLMKDK